MQTIYRLNAQELDSHIIESLKALFDDKMIEIVVTEVDETAYLMHSAANRTRLLEAIEHVNNGDNLIAVTLDDL